MEVEGKTKPAVLYEMGPNTDLRVRPSFPAYLRDAHAGCFSPPFFPQLLLSLVASTRNVPCGIQMQPGLSREPNDAVKALSELLRWEYGQYLCRLSLNIFQKLRMEVVY